MFLSRNHDNAHINDGRQEEGHIDKSYKARIKRLKKAFSDPLTKVHAPFYAYTLPLFTHYIQCLQRLDPLILRNKVSYPQHSLKIYMNH